MFRRNPPAIGPLRVIGHKPPSAFSFTTPLSNASAIELPACPETDDMASALVSGRCEAKLIASLGAQTARGEARPGLCHEWRARWQARLLPADGDVHEHDLEEK